MLRPILAFMTLCMAAFLLAPTVASVHEKVEELHVDRTLPWQIWKWDELPEPPPPLQGCTKKERHLYSEVVEWPARIQKDQPFVVRGVVQSEEDGRLGVGNIDVDLFLNETKSAPGVYLGEATSSASGSFTLETSLPFEIQASRYHLVAHAKEKRIDCSTYFEHWSDPEMEVISKTTLIWEDPGRMVVGRNTTLGGRLVDVVEAPVRNATVILTLAGKTHTLQTDEEGRFAVPYKPATPGELRLSADFRGSRFYNATRANTTYQVLEEDLDLLTKPIFLRSSELNLTGQVYVPEGALRPELELRFQGLLVRGCATCAPATSVKVPVGPDGFFAAPLVVPSSEAPGEYRLVVTGAGLRKSYTFNASVDVPTNLTLQANGTSLFGKGFEGRAVLTDEVGRPLEGTLRIVTAAGEMTNATDAAGAYSFSGSFAECGEFPVNAVYDGAPHIRPAQAAQPVMACGILAFIPPWLLAVPWWVWPLALAAAALAWQIARGWRQRYATVIVGGPALTLTFTEPRDDAVGYAGIGEAVVATAFLETPLPDGHRLRLGTSRDTREVPIDAELRAHLRIVPEKLGDVAIRAEITDAKGRIVSRRTLTLHVVRYAEEIEKRYLRLRKSSGADESVTPREFERWLHERAPAMDPELARRLVRVFEEADYSPRVAGRAEFAAYLAAEGGVKEVSADALA